MRKNIYFIPVFALIFSCHAPQSEKAIQSGFPDLIAFLDETKMATLSDTRYSKSIVFGEQKLDTVVDFQTIEKDLAIFNENVLDKPSYVGKYEKSMSQPKKVSWKANDPSLLIQLWTIDTLDNGDMNHYWEIKQENDLFEQARSMTLIVSGNNKILEYNISGFKKLTFGDSVKYKVKAKAIEK